jgi:hypothetical protein
MPEWDSLEIAHMILRRHGLQAHAIAFEKLQELRLAGDSTGMARWQQVLMTIDDRHHRPPTEVHGPAPR